MTKAIIKQKAASIKSSISTRITRELINRGFKKESREVLDQIEYDAQIKLKTDFDVVYACIEQAKTPKQVISAGNMVKNFNNIYQVIEGSQVVSSESSLLDAALQLKYKEVFDLYESFDENGELQVARVGKLDDLTMADYNKGVADGVVFCKSIKAKLGVTDEAA